ncbi:MAG: mechanosensitive ion channel domain-containing protein [Synechococcus sp.]
MFFSLGQSVLPQDNSVDTAPPTQSQTVQNENASPPTGEDTNDSDSNQPAADEDNSDEQTDDRNLAQLEPSPVMLGAEELFTLEVGLGPLTPAERAEIASENIAEFASDRGTLLESLELSQIEGVQLMVSGKSVLLPLTQADADAEGIPLDDYAQDKLEIVKNAVEEFRTSRTFKQLMFSALKAALATLGVVIAFWLTNKTFKFIQSYLEDWQEESLESVSFQGLEFLSNRQIQNGINIATRIARIAIYAFLLYLYIPFLLGSFPATAPIAVKILTAFWGAISSVLNGFINYLPSLITIIVFITIAYYSNRLSKYIFKALERGVITLPGFYTEWAQPTSALATVLIYALAGILIFPHLPASDSPGFQGISIFVGALFTLGSTSAIGNVVSGLVSIYTRAFQIGDIVDVNGVRGKVLEKSILSTQIVTPDNEIVTIPNSSLTSTNIVNYSASTRELKSPLRLSTTVTLGYDVPWRQVYEVLTNAALATDGILKDPEPFVWQTSLDDYYPSYSLRAYTDRPLEMGAVYSRLHENIQDKCNEADIEILSPRYSAIRDGNMTTIPEDYLSTDYRAPGFKVDNHK